MRVSGSAIWHRGRRKWPGAHALPTAYSFGPASRPPVHRRPAHDLQRVARRTAAHGCRGRHVSL